MPVERRGLYGRVLQHYDVDRYSNIVGCQISLEPHRQGREGVFERRGERLIDMFRAGDTGIQYDADGTIGRRTSVDHLLEAEGDAAQFTELYRAARAPVRRYLQRMIGVEDADDLTADVFVTVWSRWSEVPAEFVKRRSWVFKVAHFKVQETIRSRRYRRGLLLQLTARRVETSMPGPEDDVLALQSAREALMLLPPSERDAVALVAFGGLSGSEAADALGYSASAVTSRVSRARQRLKKVLSTDEEVHRETRQ